MHNRVEVWRPSLTGFLSTFNLLTEVVKFIILIGYRTAVTEVQTRSRTVLSAVGQIILGM